MPPIKNCHKGAKAQKSYFEGFVSLWQNPIKMKTILQTILIAGLGYLAHQFFPFWAIAGVAFVVGLFFKYKNSLSSFAAGFFGAALLWGGMAYWLDSSNSGLLSGQLGELFSMPGSYLAWATAWLGGMVGGLAAMTGTLGRKGFVAEK